MAAVLYFLVASVVLLAVRRLLTPFPWPYALSLLLLPLLFTGQALFTGRIYAPTDLAYQAEPLSSVAAEYGITKIRNRMETDVYSQMIPWRAAVRYAIQNRQWPLWNPFMFCGDILAGSVQASPYYPTYVVGYLLPFTSALTFTAALSYFLAALGMFLLSREIGFGNEASLVAGAAWAFSNFIIFFLEVPLGLGVLLLPAICFATARLIRRPSLHATIMLAVLLSSLLFAGHPESALQVIVVAVVFGVARLIGTQAKTATTILVHACVAGTLALLFAAIHLLPMLEALPQTAEYQTRIAEQSRVHESSSLPDLSQTLLVNMVPFLLGIHGTETATVIPHTLPSAYCGSVALLFAALGLWKSSWKGKWAVAGIGLTGCLLAAGTPALVRIFYSIPLLRLTLSERLNFAGSFAICLLAASGIDVWLQDRNRRHAFWFMVSSIALLLLVIALFWTEMRWMGLSTPFLFKNASIAIAPLILLVLVAVLPWPNRRRASTVLIALVLLQRAAEIGGFYPSLPVRTFYPPIAGLAKIERGAKPFRIVGKGNMLIPNTSTHYRLEDVRGFQAMTSSRMKDTFPLWCTTQPVWFNRVDDLQRPFLSALNVRYAMVPAGEMVPPGWTLVSDSPGMRLLENQNVLDRAFIPQRIRLGLNPRMEIDQMYPASDFRAVGWVSSRGVKETTEIANGPGRVSIQQKGLNLELHATLEKASWILISETAWDGWRATSEGRSVPLETGDHALLALHLEAGSHDVELHYRPRSFTVGAVCTAISLLGTIVALLQNFLSRRRRLASA